MVTFCISETVVLLVGCVCLWESAVRMFGWGAEPSRCVFAPMHFCGLLQRFFLYSCEFSHTNFIVSIRFVVKSLEIFTDVFSCFFCLTVSAIENMFRHIAREQVSREYWLLTGDLSRFCF